jgi:adenine-specific DNA-methyltransferase
MEGTGTFVVAIDEVEQERLGQLLSLHFPGFTKDCVVVNHNPSGQQGDNFSFTHEYAYFMHLSPGRFIAEQLRENSADWDERNFRDVTGDESLRTSAKNCFYPVFVRGTEIVGFGDICPADYHPAINEKVDENIVAIYPVDPGGVERKWRFARDTVEGIKDELRVHVLERRGVVDIKRLKKTFNYKSNWIDARYSANNHGTQLLNHLVPKASASYPKSLYTVRDCLHAALNGNRSGVVTDYFAGSGTTGHAVINLNREDGGKRKFILVEIGGYFDTVLLPRIKKVTFTPEWKEGKPNRLASTEEAERSPRIIKVIRLESYEDTLNNLETHRTSTQQLLLDATGAQGADGLKEQYLLRYMLNVETRGSQSLLNVKAFTDPTAYKLKVKRSGSDESREVNVDLLETFNWLIGVTVQHISAPQSFSVAFERDSEKRLRLKGRLKLEVDGSYWFRTVTGTTPDGRKTLIIWRKLTGEPEQDNLVLDEWFTKQGYSAKDSEFDLIYVNGGNNLENLKAPDDTWKVRLIEGDFHRLMFEREGA